MLGLSFSLNRLIASNSKAVIIANAYKDRVLADGGTVEAYGCLVSYLNFLTTKP